MRLGNRWPRRVLLSAVLLVCVAAAYKFRQNGSTDLFHTRKTRSEYSDLRHLMRAGLHEEFTFLSYTIWHDDPLDEKKMEAIAGSAENIIVAAQDAESCPSAYKHAGNQVDDRFFEARVQDLTQVAQKLQSAAKRHDSQQLGNLLGEMDNVCQSCHSRFRPDLIAGPSPQGLVFPPRIFLLQQWTKD